MEGNELTVFQQVHWSMEVHARRSFWSQHLQERYTPLATTNTIRLISWTVNRTIANNADLRLRPFLYMHMRGQSHPSTPFPAHAHARSKSKVHCLDTCAAWEARQRRLGAATCIDAKHGHAMLTGAVLFTTKHQIYAADLQEVVVYVARALACSLIRCE